MACIVNVNAVDERNRAWMPRVLTDVGGVPASKPVVPVTASAVKPRPSGSPVGWWGGRTTANTHLYAR
eukprot:352753-Chlamydomonas_euryale.AAC.9